MKNILWLTCFILLASSFGAMAQERAAPAEMGEMKQYAMCLYMKGPNRDQSPEEAEKLQSGHMQFIIENAEKGWIVIAGPMGEEGDLRGILIFNPELDVEFVRNLMQEDPAVAAGRLIADVKPWWSQSGATLP